MFIAYYRKILICEYILEPSTYCMSLILDSHETIPIGDLEHMITSLLSRRADKGFRVNSKVFMSYLSIFRQEECLCKDANVQLLRVPLSAILTIINEYH